MTSRCITSAARVGPDSPLPQQPGVQAVPEALGILQVGGAQTSRVLRIAQGERYCIQEIGQPVSIWHGPEGPAALLRRHLPGPAALIPTIPCHGLLLQN